MAYIENIDQEWDKEPFPAELFDIMKVQLNEPVRAIESFMGLSGRGSILSLVYLGDAYANGRHVERDINKGLAYYERAVELGSIEATHRLAFWKWNNGKHEEAIELLKTNAERNHIPAQYLLGLLYTSGNYVVKDEARGLLSLETAAAGGHLLAERKLSIMLRTGNFGIKKRILGYMKLLKILPAFIYCSMKTPDSDRLREW